MEKIKNTLSELTQSAIVLLFLYSYIANIINHAYQKFFRTPQTETDNDLLAVPIKYELCSGSLLEASDIWSELCLLAAGCVLAAIILGYIFHWVCSFEWVQKPIEVKECWRDAKSWNPASWIGPLVCTINESLRAVLQLLCRLQVQVVWGLAILCILVALA